MKKMHHSKNLEPNKKKKTLMISLDIGDFKPNKSPVKIIDKPSYPP
jgi:hypothetical protein